MIWEFIQQQLHSNPIFSGGLLAGVAVSSFHAIKSYPFRFARNAVRRIKTRIVIHSDDPSYSDVMAWLKDNNFDRYAKAYRLRTKASKMELGPDYGSYMFFAKNRKLYFVTVEKEQGSTSVTSSNQTRDFVYITCFGSNIKTLADFLDQITFYKKREEKSHVWRFKDWWTRTRELAELGSSGLVLSNGDMQELDADIEKFFRSEKEYNSLGIPYRRGYLLHGPPGTGKTSYIKHIAKKTNRDLYMIDAATIMRGNFDNAYSAIPAGSIVAIEDIDGAFIEFDTVKDDKEGKRPFDIAAILNTLDGVHSPEGLVLIATTNNKDYLDEALIRPGRFDVHKYIGLCSKEQAARLFNKWYPQEDTDEFCSNIVEDTISPATLQAIFIKSENPNQAITLLKEYNDNWKNYNS